MEGEGIHPFYVELSLGKPYEDGDRLVEIVDRATKNCKDEVFNMLEEVSPDSLLFTVTIITVEILTIPQSCLSSGKTYFMSLTSDALLRIWILLLFPLTIIP